MLPASDDSTMTSVRCRLSDTLASSFVHALPSPSRHPGPGRPGKPFQSAEEMP